MPTTVVRPLPAELGRARAISDFEQAMGGGSPGRDSFRGAGPADPACAMAPGFGKSSTSTTTSRSWAGASIMSGRGGDGGVAGGLGFSIHPSAATRGAPISVLTHESVGFDCSAAWILSQTQLTPLAAALRATGGLVGGAPPPIGASLSPAAAMYPRRGGSTSAMGAGLGGGGGSSGGDGSSTSGGLTSRSTLSVVTAISAGSGRDLSGSDGAGSTGSGGFFGPLGLPSTTACSRRHGGHGFLGDA